MKKWVQRAQDIIGGDSLTSDEAHDLLTEDRSSFAELLHAASSIKEHCIGNRTAICGIINAKSGACSEDCAFCAQSACHRSAIDTFPFLQTDQILEKAREDQQWASRFSIVTSGKRLSHDDIQKALRSITAVSENTHHRPCASLGTATKSELTALKNAGLTRYHHNLETAPSFFSSICTTHTYEERLETITAAAAAGLELCVGGIFGIGETVAQRVELLDNIRNFNPNAVPLNFLVPIPGTPLENRSLMPVFEAAKIVVLARFMFPRTDIKIGGGRLEVFKDMQGIPLLAGANGFITGSLLTVKGRNPADDITLIREFTAT